MKANNQVYLAGTATTPYRLLCTSPIGTLEELKGKRFRAGAANYARWADSLGGSSVSVPGNEIYDALSQGIVDCTMTPLGDLVGGRFVDVTDYVTLAAPGGVFSGLGAANVNRDVWQGLTDEQRAGMLRASARLAAEAVYSYIEDDGEGVAAAEEKGVEMIEGDETLRQASADFVAADVATISDQFTSQFNVQDVDQKIETLVGLIDKWKGLTRDLGEGDVDKLADLYWTEIISKVDPATHGMN